MPSPDSPCLTWVAHEPFTAAMELTFRSGRGHTLRHLPPHPEHGLPNSDSPGWHFNARLKGRH